MITKVDWISFTVKLDLPSDCSEQEVLYHAAHAINDLDPGLVTVLHLAEEWEPRNGRAPYRTGWHAPQGGVVIFTHPALSHALIEISGKGCEFLLADGSTLDVIRAVRDRLTRLDIASDMLCETKPTAFTAQRAGGRFKAHSEVVSESGETCYIGARSSDRYARVYRYNPPHERSHLLRCEFVVKAENARLLADSIASEGLEAVSMALGEVFGWEHPDWQPDAPAPAEVAVWRPERREGKTLFWLAETVAPLLVRLHKEGVIDATEWLQKHVVSAIIPTAGD